MLLHNVPYYLECIFEFDVLAKGSDILRHGEKGARDTDGWESLICKCNTKINTGNTVFCLFRFSAVTESNRPSFDADKRQLLANDMTSQFNLYHADLMSIKMSPVTVVFYAHFNHINDCINGSDCNQVQGRHAQVMIKNSSLDEIANVNVFTTTSYM